MSYLPNSLEKTCEELRAEIDRLKAARHPMHPDLYAENVKLRDEVERLKAVLREIDALAVQHEKGAIGKAQKIARAALENGK